MLKLTLKKQFYVAIALFLVAIPHLFSSVFA